MAAFSGKLEQLSNEGALDGMGMIEYVIKDVAAVLRFLPYGLVVGILVAIILSAVNDRRVRKGKRQVSVASTTAFFMYTAIILFITFLSRENGSRVGVDLELFSTFGINGRNNAYVVENVLLFIPYGFVSPWAIKRVRKFWPCALFGFFSSGVIECLQLVTGRGYFQIDDILTNALGTMIGWILFRCVLSEARTSAGSAKAVYIVLALLAAGAAVFGVIAFSSESSEASNRLSMQVASLFVEKADGWFQMNLSAVDREMVASFLNPVLRKAAHASEYAALAVVIGFGYQLMKKRRAKAVNYFYAVVMCGMLAIADELLQKYVFFRTGRAFDVAVDMLGALVGGCLYVFLSELLDFLASAGEPEKTESLNGAGEQNRRKDG